MNGSGRLSRFTDTLTGVTASTSAAIVAATAPKWRRTIEKSSATEAVPANADGSSNDHDE